MKTRVSHRHILVALVLLLALLVPTSAVIARNDNPGVLPPNAKAFGKSYEGWSAAWWQWALSQPVSTNPLFDLTGERCAEGQQGKVWFLAGNLTGGTIERACTIPTGTALFFPVLNGFVDNIGVDPPLTKQGLIDACEDPLENPQELVVKIDDTSLKNLKNYRIKPTFFSYTVPDEDSILDFFVPGNDFPNTPPPPGAVSCGYYVLLPPLTPGEHTLTIVAKGAEPPGPASAFTLDITYHLTVVPAGKHKAQGQGDHSAAAANDGAKESSHRTHERRNKTQRQ
jgi:hypothetical protein